MPKRKVTKQQLTRIKKIQAKREARAMSTAEMTADISSGKLGPEESGLLIAHYGKFADVLAANEKIYHCNLRQHLGSNVVGDCVVFRVGENHSGVVVSVLPRKSQLSRLDDYGKEKVIAANIDQIIIVISPEPAPTTLLIDSYLVAAESLHITPVLLFNKIDLLNKFPHFADIQSLYQTLHYKFIDASIVSQHGLDELVPMLTDKTSVFVGQSGVGKSSLIKTLIPHEEIVIGELHETTTLGKHTTTTARLYHLPFGGNLIDSPGIREFGLWKMEPQEIAKCFIEFRPFISQCKFRNCRHLNEPECEVVKAVQDGEIYQERLDNYRKLITQS